MLDEYDYNTISDKILHKDAHGAKEMQLELSHQLFNCDYVRGDSDKDSNTGDVTFGVKMLKQKTRGKNWKDHQKTPGGATETVLKIAAKFLMRG